ncbi:type II secretion system F family protein [Patescibacteria group bacterium]|nr:type II secretion system F family protein [Patescibacteria group bacterium]HOM77912.1 type II secretion system F family protein [bacterium]
MPIYKYTALDQAGKKKTGTVEAKDKSAALGLLKQEELFVTGIEKSQQDLLEVFTSLKGVSSDAVVAFTRQFSTMISAGLPLSRSLEVLIGQVDSPKFRKILSDVLKDVEGGSTLSDAFGRYPDIFSKTYQALVRAGESSGNLDVILKRLATTMEAERELKSKFKGAMIYPAIVMIAMVGVFILMMIMVIPQLSDMYASMDIALPLPTQIMISISSFMTSNVLITLCLIIGFVASVLYFKKTEFGKKLLSELSYKIPVFGKINKSKEITSFARTLSLLINSAIPIVEALHIVADVVGGLDLQQSIRDAAVYVERGNSLSEFFRGNKTFPPLLGQMSGVGEETGKMDEVLEKVADYYEGETSSAIENLSAALEPLILVLLGSMVGLMIFSIITPIYNLTTSI